MKILIVEPGKHPRKADIPHTLSNLQGVVGGYIQAVYPWKDRVGLVCDEEGLLKHKPFNRLINPDLAIFGTFFLCGLDEEDFTDLPDELAGKYELLLHEPEMLFRTETGHVVIPLKSIDESEWEDELE